MLDVVGVLLITGPVFMVRCLAVIDVALDGLDVVGVEGSNPQGQVAESQADPKVLGYMLDMVFLAMICIVHGCGI